MPAHSTSRTLGRDDVFVVRTLDGSDTLYSRLFNATYHSINGAVSESRHVFIQHGLCRHLDLAEIHVLEIGFGSGLNAFLTFLFSEKNKKPVIYTGLESFPIDTQLVLDLNYPSYLVAEDRKDVFLKMHQELSFATEYFKFKKYPSWEKIESSFLFDCIFFDAFAPADQPEWWDQNIFDQLYGVTSEGGFLVTYCAQGEVRRRMERAGYRVNRLPGAPGKREMIRCLRSTQAS